MAEFIEKTDTLNQGRVKLNSAIKDAEDAKNISVEADEKATQALANSESTQTQLDTIVIEGDSSVEAAQARVDEKGEAHPTLKARIDNGFTEVTSQLAQTAEELEDKKADKLAVSQLDSKIDRGLDNKADKSAISQLDSKIDRGLDNKVDKGGNEQVTWAMASQDFKEQITGGNTAVVGVNSVNTSNLVNGSVTFSKRTRIGDMCAVQISTSGDIPNIDVNDMTINFPSTFWVIVGKNRYEITNGILLDYSSIRLGSTQVLIYFDTAISDFIITYSGGISSVPESAVFFGALGFTSSRLRDITLPCRYYLNGYTQDLIDELLLADNIINSRRTVSFHASGRVHRVRYYNEKDELIREDTFNYDDPIITEVRNHRTNSITLIHNTDTLETEVY